MKENNVIKVILKSVCVSDSNNTVATASDLAPVSGIISLVNNIGRQLQNASFIFIMSKGGIQSRKKYYGYVSDIL